MGWPTGVVTFLFTDVEGSTARWRQDEDAMATAMRVHDALLSEVIERHGGIQFKHTGDGVIAAFESPAGAFGAAIDAQERLELPVRMGVHTGHAELRDGDYFGTTLNRAARVMDAGHGGQILVSEMTASLLDDVGLTDLGLYELKGLDGNDRVFQAGDADYPALRATPAVLGNLPRSSTAFIGRDADIARVISTVQRDRAVTLFGVGGTGKTRLATEVGRRLGPTTDRGCWFVDLGRVGAGESVTFAIANGLGFQPAERGDVIDDLVRRLGDRTVVVIVDNCEHLLDDVAECVERLLDGCPGVRVLATSREPLMIEGEQVVPVGALTADDSVALFVERARAESPDLDLDELQSAAVGELCERLDGLPLAIELAAARVRSLTPVDLLDGLSERFRLLTGSRRSRSERHQTMRATLDWSYELCADVERTIFDELSVFPSHFDLDAAAAVVGGGMMPRFEVADIVARLVDRSLLQSSPGRDGGARYRMLETMRAYGRDHLTETGRIDDVRDGHSRYVSQRLNELTLDALGQHEAAVFGSISELLADATAAFDRYLDQRDWEAAVALLPGYWFPNFREHAELAERLDREMAHVGAAHPVHDEVRLVASNSAAFAAVDASDPEANWIWSALGNPVVLEHRDSYSPAIRAMDLRDLADEQIERLASHLDAFDEARPLTQFLVYVGVGRAMAFNGRGDLLDDVATRVERRADELGSDLLRSAALEMRAQFCRTQRDWSTAADLLARARQLRVAATGTSISGIALLMRWHEIAARAISGQPAGPVELLSTWAQQRELGSTQALFRSVTATAVALHLSGHVDLARQFVANGHRIDESGVFDRLMAWPSYRSELDAIGFEQDLDAEVLSLDELLERLRSLG